MLKDKAIVTAIAMLLITSMTITLVCIPTAGASNAATNAAKQAGMKWDFPEANNYDASANRLLLWNRWKDKIPTYVFVSATPKTVGVGQQMTFIFFNPQVPPGAYDDNDVRYEYSLTITRSDGTIETLPSTGTYKSDSTGAGWATYTPTQIGNHSVTVKFHELLWRWWYDARPNPSAAVNATFRDYYGVTLQSSTYTTTFTVQEEQVKPIGWTDIPLPSEYWARPIEGHNTQWYQISSNWLNNAHDSANGGANNRYQQHGIAPTSGHILWTKVTEDGGVLGGGNFSVPGEVFNTGHQYQTRFSSQIIMWGRLYYQLPLAFGGGGGGWICVDLRTGETVWYEKDMGATGSPYASPSFGYYYDFDDMNQHGIVNPGWLFTSNFGASIHPRYGTYGLLNLTNVPSGTEVIGPKGEVLRYAITNTGTSSKPDWRLTQWNSSNVFLAQRTSVQGTYPANAPITPSRPSLSVYWNGSSYVTSAVLSQQGLSQVTRPAYDYNVSLPVTFANTPTIRGVMYNDVLLVSNGTLPSAPSYVFSEEATFWGISLRPGQVGQVLWGPTTIKLVTSKNQNYDFQRAAEGVFVFQRTPEMGWVAYSMYTGQKLWETSWGEGDYNPYAYYISSTGYNPTGNSIANGKLFSAGYVGMVFCYDLKSGDLLWRYEAPTNMEKFEYYTLLIGAVTNDKIYIGTHEHSADTPLFKGNRIRCLDVNTGEEIWSLLGWANPNTMALADGTLIYWNNYDHQVYAIGKGPMSMTVSAPDIAVPFGTSMMIKGRITDVSAGTKQPEQAARFPNGVPAVSDESMSAWMEYVYMQKTRPTNATGVQITVSVVDANGNYRDIGTTTSDADGFFSLNWLPDIEGMYTVYASFAGSESYWPTHAVTAFTVAESTPTASPFPQISLPPIEMYVIGVGAAIIAAVAIVGFLLMMAIKRRA